MSEPKEYRHETVVTARQCAEDERVITTNGPAWAVKGDWIVAENGVTSVSPDDEFRDRFLNDADESHTDDDSSDDDSGSSESESVKDGDEVVISKSSDKSDAKPAAKTAKR